MNVLKYYRLILDGKDREGGVMTELPNIHYPKVLDGEEVTDWKAIVIELRDGKYRPFDMGPECENVVNEELKCLLEPYCEPGCVDFLPLQVTSKEYGDKIYYIVHFTKIYDVLDKENTVYIETTGSIIQPAFDYEKVKSLHVFNYRPFTNDIVVSEEVFKAIKKNKLDLGMNVAPAYCLIK